MLRIKFGICSAVLLTLASLAIAHDPPTSSVKVHKIPVGGEGGWDYLTVDSPAHRLYVSRGNRIAVVDLENEKVVGELTETPGVHGVAVVPDLSLGFTSNGGDDTVTAFHLKTLKTKGKIKVGGRPDAIMFDPISKRVFTYNHGSKDATAVDPAEMKVVGSVKLEGVPEAAVSDGKGHVFVNIMDKNEIVEFDAKTLDVLKRWSIAPGQRPTGLALDSKNHRLFSVCGNQKMIVADSEKGTVLATLDIGRGSDGCMFDQEKGLAFSSNGGDGTLSVVKETDPGKFAVVETIPTQPGARTMTLDPQTHKCYLSSATAAPAQAQEKGKEQTKGRRRAMVPGSFVIIVVGD